MNERIRIGLVGAGPWARTVHAPGIMDHPGTTLRAAWARRPEAAREVAEPHGAAVAGSFAELVDQVDAVAFAVPPSVQAELAPVAARAGKHLILEKPLAADLDSARAVADAVAEHDVAALMMFTLRYATETREWLADVGAADGWRGGEVRWLSAALLGEKYGGSAWRHDQGALADIGPHAIDLIDAALGPVTEVIAARRDDNDLVRLMLAHENGAVSTIALSLRLPIEPTVAEFAVFGEPGYRCLARRPGMANECYTALLNDFTTLIASGARAHPSDVQRGLHIQQILEQARAVLH